MTETLIVALTTFFATIGPIDVSAMYAALTANSNLSERRAMALRGVVVATVILLAFALLGELILKAMGITLPALRTAGGILLLLIGIELVTGRASGATSTTEEEDAEAQERNDISVFPLGTPLIAGPGAIGAVILLMANTEGQLMHQAMVIIALLSVLLFTLVCLLIATQLQRLLGVTGMQMISRVFGVLLCALAVQFLFDGIRLSGLLG